MYISLCIFLIIFFLFFIGFGKSLIKHFYEKVFIKTHEEFVGQTRKGPWIDFTLGGQRLLVCTMHNFNFEQMNGKEEAMFTTLLYKIEHMQDMVEKVERVDHKPGRLFSFKIFLKPKVNSSILQSEIENKIKIHFSFLFDISKVVFKKS